MNPGVAASLRRSSEDFLSIVWPQIGRQFGRIVPVESVTANEFATELDARAGIDNWMVGTDGHMRGLASRVQWPKRDGYGTFTIRVRSRTGRETEYHKRRRELETDGVIRPHYVCQAYVRCVNDSARPGHRACGAHDHTRLIQAAIARMRDVIEAVTADHGELMKPNADGTQGYVVPWSVLPQRYVMVWPDPVGSQLTLAAAALPPPTEIDGWPEVTRPADWKHTA